MIHRVVFGSIERFIGILTEHFAGRVPDVALAGAGEDPPDFRASSRVRKQIEKQLADAGLRVECDERGEKIGYKIREAQLEKSAVYAHCGR